MHSLQTLQFQRSGLHHPGSSVISQAKTENLYHHRETSWRIMDVGRKKAAVFCFFTPCMEPPSCCRAALTLSGRNRKVSRLRCLLGAAFAPLSGVRKLVRSHSGNARYQKFRRIPENVAMKWNQICRWYWRIWVDLRDVLLRLSRYTRAAQLATAISFMKRWTTVGSFYISYYEVSLFY